MTGVVVPAGSAYLNTDSGLSAPGGFLDRLTQAMDTRAQYQGQLRGFGPALNDAGVPVSVPGPSILSQMLGAVGLGAQASPSSPPAMPLARASQSAVAGDGAAPPTSGGMPASPASAPGGGMMGMFGNAIAGIESGGKYDALGPQTQSGDQPLGKYQVMASNVGPWTKEVLGQELTPQQFLASPQAQDAVFQGKFGQYLQKTGNPADAASMWFTGRPQVQGAGAQDQLGTTGASYVSKFMAALPGGGGGAGGLPAQATAYSPAGGSGDMQRAPAVQALNGAAPMPIATASIGAQQAPQPSPQPAAGAGPMQSTAAASPGQVLAPLMANPSTRQLGGQMWQGALQRGGGAGMPGSMNLPAGMTPQSLAAMIAEPTTQQMGLALWQRSLFPPITTVKPGETIMRGAQIMGQAPSAPMDVGPGHAVVNPNTGGAVAAVPPEMQHAEIGRDAYGQPTYGTFNPQSGAATPFAGGQGSTAGAAVGPDGHQLTGSAFLGTLPPAIANQVQAIADGRVKLPSGMGAANPMAQRMRAAVLQYDPSFDQAGVDARFETRADFAKGDAAKTITAGNTALIHLGELSSLADKLGNADTSILGNNAYNYLRNEANSSSAAGAPLAAFNSTASKYVEEATKFYRGTGGTEGDISRDMLNLSPNMSPTQIKAAIGAQIPLIQGKVDAMQSRWRQGMGPKAGDYPIMSPQAQSVLDRLGPQASAGTAPASANLPVAAPAGGAAPPSQAPAVAGSSKTIRGVTYTLGPDGHWYMGQ